MVRVRPRKLLPEGVHLGVIYGLAGLKDVTIKKDDPKLRRDKLIFTIEARNIVPTMDGDVGLKAEMDIWIETHRDFEDQNDQYESFCKALDIKGKPINPNNPEAGFDYPDPKSGLVSWTPIKFEVIHTTKSRRDGSEYTVARISKVEKWNAKGADGTDYEPVIAEMRRKFHEDARSESNSYAADVPDDDDDDMPF